MSESHTSPEQGPPTLHCCGGRPAPEPVLEGWAHLDAMPTSVRQDFVEVLSSSVAESDEAALVSSLAGFCDAHGIERDAAVAALRACQFLFHRAAALDLDPEHFVEDLHRLSPERTGALRVIGSRYAPLKQQIREGLLIQALADHGDVLVDLDWRVDTLTSSDRAVGLNAPVVFLSLHLRDARESKRVSVQLTTGSIRKLQQFCQRFSEE